MSAVPDRQAAVVLRDQQGAAYRSEVIESHPGVLMLRPPPNLPAEGAFALGTRLLVTWPDDRSLWVLPVVMIGIRPVEGVGLLVAEVSGESWREERRHYVRAAIPAALSIEYRLEAEAEPVTAEAELIDLSEVALRCVISPQHQRLCQPRTQVRVRVELSGDAFDIEGYVLLGKPTARLDLGLELVVLFDRPVPRVQELRRHLAAPTGEE